MLYKMFVHTDSDNTSVKSILVYLHITFTNIVVRHTLARLMCHLHGKRKLYTKVAHDVGHTLLSHGNHTMEDAI